MPPGRATDDPLAPLREEELGPLYLVYGKERFLVERAVDLIRSRALDPRTRDFNQDVFEGRGLEPARLLAAARTLPMMARRRLVLVRDADQVGAETLNELLGYLDDPCAQTCLVFVAEKADQRLKFFATLKKRGIAIKLDPLYERQLPAFVQKEARARKVSMETGAAELLCNVVGGELGQLADAIERLAIFCGERAVTVADVKELVRPMREHTVFELANAIGRGDRQAALAALSSMTGSGESGVRVVAMLARHLRQLWQLRELEASRSSRGDMASAIGVPPFFLDDLLTQARRLGRRELVRMHDALYRADRLLKSSPLEDSRLLEGLTFELTRSAGGRRG